MAEVADCETAIGDQFRTDPGRAIGTPRYMSPEQIRAQEVDGRSDIFSLGAALYELIAGRPAFEGATPFEVIAAVLDEDAPPLARYSREVPPELERIVSKALQKDREERYQTARDLLIDLKNLKLELEVAAKLKRTGKIDEHAAVTLLDQPLPTSSFEAAGEAAGKVAGEAAAGEAAGKVAGEAAAGGAEPSPSSQKSLHEQLEPVGGAVPLDSKFYIARATDDEFQAAIARQDSIVLVKGARQVGKTSLLARGLQQARAARASSSPISRNSPPIIWHRLRNCCSRWPNRSPINSTSTFFPTRSGTSASAPASTSSAICAVRSSPKSKRRWFGEWTKLTGSSPAIMAAKSSVFSAPGTTNARSIRRDNGVASRWPSPTPLKRTCSSPI
jgi:serine/threonine protein kinase